MRIHPLPLLLSAALLAACGQKGNLYQPDEGITVPPAAPAPAASGPAAAPVPATEANGTPATPAPDRTDEPRKRIHTP